MVILPFNKSTFVLKFLLVHLKIKTTWVLLLIVFFSSEMIASTFNSRHSSLKYINRLYKENKDSLVIQACKVHLTRFNTSTCDSIYAKIHKRMGYSYLRLKEYDQAKKNIEVALACFKQISDRDEVMNSLYRLSLTAFYQSKYQDGLKLCDQLLAIADPCVDIQWVEGMNFKGVIYRKIGEYKNAIKVYNEALRYIDSNHEHYKMTITNLASAYENAGEFLLALHFRNQLLKLSIQENNITGQVLAYNGIGFCYYMLENDLKALEMYDTSLQLATQAEKEINLSVIRERMGLSYKRMGQIEKAKPLFEQNFKEAQENKDSSTIAYALLQLGEIDHLNGKFDDSNKKLLQALDLFNRFNIKSGYTYTLVEVAILHRKKGNAELYIKFLRDAFNSSKSMDDKLLLLTVYKEISQSTDMDGFSFLSINDYKNINKILANEYENKSQIINQLIQKQMNEIQLESQINEQKKQILLEEKKDLIRNIIILAIILVILSLFFAFYIFQNHKTSKLNKIINEQHQQMKLYYMALSHDLKHPLLSIQSQIKQLHTLDKDIQEKSRISDRINAILHLSQRLINIFDLESTDIHLKKINLAELIEDILDMLEYEYHGIKSKVNIEGEAHFLYGDTFLMRQLLNNLIINSIQHNPGFNQLAIKIRNMVSSHNQYLEYSDNGKGISADDSNQIFQPGFTTKNTNNQSVSGLGMFIVKKIIEKHNGLVKVLSNEQFKGFKMVIELPFKNKS